MQVAGCRANYGAWYRLRHVDVEAQNFNENLEICVVDVGSAEAEGLEVCFPIAWDLPLGSIGPHDCPFPPLFVVCAGDSGGYT